MSYPKPIHWWVDNVLPLVYSEALSYMEVVGKITEYVNGLTTDMTTVKDQIEVIEAELEQIDPERIADLLEEVDALETLVGGFENRIEALESAMTTVGEKISTLESDVDDLDTLTGSLESSVQNFGDRLGEVEESTADFDERIATAENLASTASSNVAALGLRVDDAEAKVEDIEDVADNFAASVGESEEWFTATRDYTSGELVYVGGNLYKAIANITSGDSLVIGTNISATTVSDEIVRLNGESSGLDGRLDTAESDIDAVEGRLDTAESDIDAVEGRLDTAESDIDAVEGRLDTAESDIDAVEGRLDTAESDIDAVEGRLDTAESDINNNSNNITNLKSATSDIKYAVQTGFLSPTVWVNGSWSDASSPTPQLTDRTDRIRPINFINVYKGDTVSVDNASLYGHIVGIWKGKLGSATNVRNDQSFNTNNENFYIAEDGFLIVVFADASDTSTILNPDEFTGSITINTYTSKEIQKANDSISIIVSKGNNRLVYSDNVVNNIICPYDVKRGYYVNTDGVERSSPDWSVTDYIPVVGGESLYFGNTGLTCFYKADYSFDSYRTGSYTAYTVPSTAAFMRVSILIASLPTAAVNRGSVQKPYDDGIIHYNNRFKPYESGYVYFTVPVNQINWNRNANMGTDRATLDAQYWVDVNCYIKLPGTYTRSGQPTKLLMLCHGAGKGIKTTDSDDNWCGYEHYDNLVSAFVANGYAVFDCNGYANISYACSFWGNRRGVQAWKNAYQYIIDNYNVEHQFSIYAFSMGSLTAMSIAADLYPNIKCMALGSPVTNLKAMWDEGNNAAIADIYGMASTTVYEDDKVLGCDPQKSILTIDNTDYFVKQLPPIKAWFGSTETQPSPTDCNKMINAIKNTNGIAQLRMVDNATHSICFGAEPLITAEYISWINRWNSIGRHN